MTKVTPWPPSPLALWAVREILRRPLEGLLTGAALAMLVLVAGIVLLVPRALSDTAAFLLKEAPSLVVRRVTAGGWAPIPLDPAVAAARAVPGVIGVTPRIWGAVTGPNGPVTAWAVGGEMAPGEVMVGAGVGSGRVDGGGRGGRSGQSGQGGQGGRTAGGGPEPGSAFLTFDGAVTLTLRVAGRWPDRAGLIAHDLVLLHPDDGRRLLGIPAGYASDLAVSVFHEDEAEAIRPDLAAAFPWPVRITTRGEAVGRYLGLTGRWGGIGGASLLPALLGLALLIAGSVRQAMGRRRHIGLLKAMGWTTPEIVRLQLYRSLGIGLPAVAVGMAAAYGLVFWPGTPWLGFLLPVWEGGPPGLYLHPAGALSVLLQVAALVVLPYLTAVLWPAIRLAAADPEAFLRDGSTG